jgi:hypothetical protein
MANPRIAVIGRQIVNGRKNKPSLIILLNFDTNFSAPTVKAVTDSSGDIMFDASDAKVVQTQKSRVIVRIRPNKDHAKLPKKRLLDTVTGDLTITLTDSSTDTDYIAPVEYVDDTDACP